MTRISSIRLLDVECRKFAAQTPLAGLTLFCQTSRPKLPVCGDTPLLARFHSTRRIAAAAVIALLLGPTIGCAFFKKDTWDLDHYRDERAVDIEHRLERSEPIVKSPF